MRFYRSFSPVSAISFDLDDTLYANQAVIVRAEQKSYQALQQSHPALSNVSHLEYQLLQVQLSQQQPALAHDLTELRRQSVMTIMRKAGLSQALSQNGSDRVMEIFHFWRNKVAISATTHRILAELASQVPLIAMSNGNANLDAMGLVHYFHQTYRAGPDGRAKPWPDLFYKASQDLNIAAEKILHVGDNLLSDVSGAIQQGYQTCWYNHRGQQCLKDDNLCRFIPHMEITRLAELTTLTFAKDNARRTWPTSQHQAKLATDT